MCCVNSRGNVSDGNNLEVDPTTYFYGSSLRALRMSFMYMLYMMMVPCVKITWWIWVPAGWNNSPDLEDEDSSDYVYTVDREALIYSSAGWNSYRALRTSAAIATS